MLLNQLLVDAVASQTPPSASPDAPPGPRLTFDALADLERGGRAGGGKVKQANKRKAKGRPRRGGGRRQA